MPGVCFGTRLSRGRLFQMRARMCDKVQKPLGFAVDALELEHARV